jgi:2-polyprenyl-3-methyl-5-hydroxy-6-metoxy-1,4-benzoquinol methylase
MRIPILRYDPIRIHGNDYRDNALKALASDLRQVTRAGFTIVPLRSVVDAWLDNRGGELNGKLVALTCDHGTDFDFHDLPHPSAGKQRSVVNILRDFAREHDGAQRELHVTSFVVASPRARAELDRTCMIGSGWWTEEWWNAAIATGLMHISNNSWDHNHETLPESLAPGVGRGTFSTIATRVLADHEIRRAAEYLRERAPNPGTALFAYPYGEANAYLVDEYFPRHGAEIGIKAAFTAKPGFLEPGVGRWLVPRFVCGRDWTSPDELQDVLDAAADAERVWVPMAKPVEQDSAPASSHEPSSTDSTSKEGFLARFDMVPRVLADWIGATRPLAGADILDFGCGEGVSALALALNHGARRVVGVDIGPDPARCLPIAEKHLGLAGLPPNLALHRVTPGFLHSDRDRFDIAYSWSVFEHVDQRLVADVLELIRSSLKPDGLFLVQIAPLYYSAEGAHLHHRLGEPWVHLLSQDSVLYDKLAAAVRDKNELEALWGTYRTLNRVTADELMQHIEGNGFEIVRSWREKDPRVPPERLRAVFHDDILTTHQVVVLARPA